MSYGQPPPYSEPQNYPPGPPGPATSANKYGYDYGQGSPQYGYDQPPPAQTSPYAVSAVGASYSAPQASQQTTVNMHAINTRNSAQFEDNSTVAGFNAGSFSDKAIRHAFIRKVYMILSLQLLVTLGFIALFIFVKPVKAWVQEEGAWFYYVSYVTFLVTYIAMICCPSVRRQSPGNFICLSIFTLVFSYMVATISSFYDTKCVLLAAGITAAVCISISIFAVQTKIDFTVCSGLLFALVMVLFWFGWTCLITYYAWGYNYIMDAVYSGLGALVFALFLVFDTQLIMGGRKYELSAEEYIFAALQLYIDIVYIFLFILGMFGKK
ncbi:hypothetical protein BaRGS_00027691 [Batillaria attramentaria]|uniref:Uncharacterized protein n=1 Tax=Batillaria attramentaria TaxID=370345 RepID=A0ABD0K0Z8_9CAEN